MDFMHQTNGTSSTNHDTYIRLDKSQSLLHPYRGAIEVLTMLPLYSVFMRTTLAYIKGFPRSRKAAVVGYPPRTIPIHVFICLAVLGHYYSRLLFTEEPVPNTIDFGLGATQLATGFYLAKWTPNKRKLYKSSFLAMPHLMVYALASAYVTESPQWYCTYVKCVEWFVHFRLVALAIQKYHVFESQRIPQDALLHMVSVPVTLALADWSMAIPIYFVLLALIIPLNEWVTRQAPNRSAHALLISLHSRSILTGGHSEAKRPPFVGLLVAAGFCEHQTLRPPIAVHADADAVKLGKRD